MVLLVLLAVLAVVAFGAALAIHWLLVVAIVAALLWVISALLGGLGGRRRGAFW